MHIVRNADVAEVTLLLPAHAGDALTAVQAAFRLHVAGLTVDLIARAAWRHGRRLPLTPREFAILAVLARAAEPVSPEMLLAEVWGARIPTGSNLIAVHLSRLRAKLNDAGAGEIETVPGQGWRLAPAGSAAKRPIS